MNYIHIGKVLKRAVQDSLRNSFKKEFFEKKGAGRYSWDSETNFAVRYMACIDSNKVVKILKINDVKVAENIEYLDEFNRNEYKYQAKNNNGAKLINGKMFLTDRFSPNFDCLYVNSRNSIEERKSFIYSLGEW